MSGAHIAVDDEGVLRLTQDLEDRLGDLEPVAQAWSMIMLRSAQKNFEAQGRPTAWQELAASTLAHRKKEGAGAQILRDRGLLMASLMPTSTNEYSVRNIGNGIAYVGTTRPGAENHQEGITLPQRIFLLHQDEDIEDYKQVVRDHVIRGEINADQ